MKRALLLSCSALALVSTLSTAPSQSDWRVLSPMGHPSGRLGHAMAYDSWRDRVVLFGGLEPGIVPKSDTWVFDGTSWTQLATAHSPPPRAGHTMVFDPGTGRILLFGGDSHVGSHYFDDTWQFDGSDWIERAPATVPRPRKSHAIAYDPVAGAPLMFGGRSDSAPSVLGDTWTWDEAAGDWQQLSPSISPGARYVAALAADPVNGGLVLYGGSDGSNETWLWDGSTWSQAFPPNDPGARRDHTMTTDPVRRRVVLFGSTTVADTWEWDGSDWLLRAPVTQPSPRIDQDAVFDTRRERLVMFGGSGYEELTWEYAMTHAASFVSIGAGCQGTSGTPRLGSADRAWLGESMTTRVTALPAGPAWMLIGFGAIEVDLGVIGMPGCDLLAGPGYGVPLLSAPLAVTAGEASFTLPIGRAIGMLDVTFFVQAIGVDPGANPLGAVTSNGGRAVVGAK